MLASNKLQGKFYKNRRTIRWTALFNVSRAICSTGSWFDRISYPATRRCLLYTYAVVGFLKYYALRESSNIKKMYRCGFKYFKENTKCASYVSITVDIIVYSLWKHVL